MQHFVNIALIILTFLLVYITGGSSQNLMSLQRY